VIKATKGNVILTPIDDPLVSFGSRLVVPDGAVLFKEFPTQGRIISMGGKPITKKGVVLEPEFKVGDRVFIPKGHATLVIIEEKVYMQTKQHEITAVIYETTQ
jgi:co-chaperonin GroES (HSP10)